MEKCPCGSGLEYVECCSPLIKGEKSAATAEQLMRSRYTAYVKHEIPYLSSSLHPEHRGDFNESSARKWAESSVWHKLEILKTEAGGPGDAGGIVEFIASFTQDGKRTDHHEVASFKKEDTGWFFVDGQAPSVKPVVRSAPKVGRNDPCGCGSGKKHKKCCGA